MDIGIIGGTMKEATLHSYFAGTASEAERREVLAWVQESPENKAEFLRREADFVFDTMPIREVIKKMERWYGVEITVADSKVMNNTFTASFRSESLQQVLTLLDITCGIKSKIKSPTEVELR